MKEKLRYLITFILATITTFSINLNLDMNVNLLSSFSGNSIIYVMLFFMLCVIIDKVLQIKEKRLIICTSIISFILAMFEVIGYSINQSMDLSYIIFSKTTILKSIIKFIGMFNVLYISIIMLYTKIFPVLSNIKDKQIKFFTNNKRSFFIAWVVLFLVWIPYLLKYFPGITTPDSMDQIYQTQGINILTNHHPVLHTFFIGIAINIGKMFNNYNIGVAIYSVIQMLVMSAMFSYTLYYMSEKGVNNYIKIMAFLFYAFYPVFGMYSITMWKDIPFAIVMLWFILEIIDLVQNSEQFLNSKKKIALFILSMILVIMFRNNGIYVVFITILFLLFYYRKSWKKIIIISSIPIIFYLVFTGPIFNALNIAKGSIREALSIPLQQFARIEKDRGRELTEQELKSIHNFLPTENLPELYNPTLSDPVKACFNDEYFKENKIEFIFTWIKLVIKYPVEAIEAFLCNNYGYWYPEAQNWVVSRDIANNYLGIQKETILSNNITNLFDKSIDYRNIPAFSMILSIGFMFWINLIILIYVIYKKKYKNILIFIPILAMWLTTIASPVFCEYRYVFSMVVTLPVIVSSISIRRKEIEEH